MPARAGAEAARYEAAARAFDPTPQNEGRGFAVYLIAMPPSSLEEEDITVFPCATLFMKLKSTLRTGRPHRD
jgi:hypothetical protein